MGPAVEAFGFERIVFGSAPSPVSRAQSNVGDWYKIAREAFAELASTRRALMLCLEVMHNVSMRLGRMDMRERAFCRLFIK